MVRLNRTHSLLNLQAKFFEILYFGQIPANYTNSTQFTHHSPRIMRNSHHLLTYYTLCFRHLPQQRTLRNSSELCKFRMVCPHSPQTTGNSHHLLTYYTLCFRCLTSGRELSKIPVKFAQFAHISRELREFCAFRSKIHPYLVD